MPCNCDHMDPNEKELNYSKILCVMFDIKGISVKEEWWEGYHPEAYYRTIDKSKLDDTVKIVCDMLSVMKNEEIKKLSLESQIWWRDHQKQTINERKMRNHHYK